MQLSHYVRSLKAILIIPIKYCITVLTIAFLLCERVYAVESANSPVPDRWTPERVQAWYNVHPWLVGAKFIPSTAINQLEMWQSGTFDPATINRELGYAQSIGMNTMRVFLHDLAWREDPEGFYTRMDEYLEIADRHGIKTLFVR